MEANGFTQDGTVDLHGRPISASRTGKWKACLFLLAYEAFERMAFYGIAANLVVYLTTKLHQDTVSSVRSVNNWSGSVWITPILGAYVADTYAGRFWTFTVSAIIYTLGMGMLTLAVSLKSVKPTCTRNNICTKPTPSQMAFFFSSLYIIAIGAGGTKPNISTFGADQFDDFDPKEKKLKISFFNWWIFSSFLGGLIAALVLVYIQDNLGWGLGYGIPTIGLLVSLVIFYIGTPFYRHKKKTKVNPMKDIVGTWAAAFGNRRVVLPDSPSELYELDHQEYLLTGKRQLHHTNWFRFMDKAAIRTTEVQKPHTVTQVEASKLVLGMSLVWLTTLIPCTIGAQANTLFVKQGTTLVRKIGTSFEIPAASLGGFITISMLLTIPIYDRIFVPFMIRKTGNPRGITLLQRVGIGFALNVFVTGIAWAVEVKRMHTINLNRIQGIPIKVVPMNIFWLLPQYVLLGIADVFTAVGVIEFFYDQSPEDMQSLGTTFFTSGIGVGNFVNSLLVTVIDGLSRRGGGKSWIGNDLNDSRLDYYYAFLTFISLFNVGVFLWLSVSYNYKNQRFDLTSVEKMDGKGDQIPALEQMKV